VHEAYLFYPPEVLNGIDLINFPQHKLVLKPGVPIMLLRNLSANGLCNGTRLIVKELADRVIQAVIMTGSHIGDVVYIPRIELISNKTRYPFLLKRRQFPVRVCYAMTINKSQGQTLSFVGVYLKQPVFTHGQLYVAISRVTSRAALKILILNADGSCGSETRNIVYPEVYASCSDF
jgi:ATP-dependent exoDNAse (exonuclease V) alpha subunit